MTTDSRTDPLEEDQLDLDKEEDYDYMDEGSQTLHDLRIEHREVKKKLKEQKAMEAQVLAEVTRDFTIERKLKALGHPAGMLETVKGKLKEGAPVSQASVRAALIAVGFDEESVDQSSQVSGNTVKTPPGTPAPEPGSALNAEITRLVAGESNPDVSARIANAETPEELEEVMRDAGLKTDAY